MSWKNSYERWLEFSDLDQELREQLEGETDELMLEDRFYKNLEFGTGGMRGEIGVGINRLNVYTVRKATKGLAHFIEKSGDGAKGQGVVVAYDSRHKSPEFALEVAKVLGAHGIVTYLFESLRATPILSFAVRYLNTFSGIVLTASHNPPAYNGYKVYGEDGGQLPPDAAAELVGYVNATPDELLVEIASVDALKSNGLLKMIGADVDAAYLANLKEIVIGPEMIRKSGSDLSIVFSPLHGTSNDMVQRGLKELGFSDVTVVKEQEMPDPDFSTVVSPNPEEHAAFEYAIRYGKRVSADVLLATDPDADRLGVAVKDNKDDYLVLTGNQMGALMLEYLLSQKKGLGILPANGVVLKTIVTSEMGRVIARGYGIDTIDTLTGFKFIGEKIHEYKQSSEYEFQFGYEESYGYLIGDFVRDKDAIQAAMLACEVALYYKKQGKSMYEALIALFDKYGYFCEDLHALTLKGILGLAQIQSIMNYFRESSFTQIAGYDVLAVEDYDTSERKVLGDHGIEKIDLPRSNVLKYYLTNDAWFCLRPSGTEPKIKFYFGVKEDSLNAANQRLLSMKADVLAVVNKVVGGILDITVV